MKKIIEFLIFSFFISFNSQGQSPTWSDNIACIIYSHCTSCHNSNGIAPFSLMDYSDALIKSSEIQQQVTSKKMPPWPSDENYQQHGLSRTLTQEEINAINDWVNAGAPSGNLTKAPIPPTYSNVSQLPDKNFSLTTPVYHALTNYDDWECFAFKINIDTDTYIKAWEIVASNPKIIHHVEFYSDTSAVSYTSDTINTQPGYWCDVGIPIGSIDKSQKGVWFPGSFPYRYPSGLSSIIKKKSTITIAVHFAPDRMGDSGNVQLNLVIDTIPKRSVTTDWALGISDIINGPFFIPADSVKIFYASGLLTKDITIISVQPHMHLLGKSFKTYAVTPLNDTIRIVNIPDWDFHWQLSYFFQRPIKVPAGSQIKSEVVYDNTPANLANPNSPPIDVLSGFGSKDEMMVLYIGFLDYVTGDENIVVDTVTHINHYMNCVSVEVKENPTNSISPIIYPNPADENIYLYSPTKGYSLELSNNMMLLLKEKITDSFHSISVRNFPNGIYYLSIYDKYCWLIDRKKIIILK